MTSKFKREHAQKVHSEKAPAKPLKLVVGTLIGVQLQSYSMQLQYAIFLGHAAVERTSAVGGFFACLW